MVAHTVLLNDGHISQLTCVAIVSRELCVAVQMLRLPKFKTCHVWVYKCIKGIEVAHWTD